MPRLARIIPPEGFLHVISRGNNRRKIFLNPRDFKAYYLFLKKLKKEEAIKIFHYCIMPSHVHLLVGVGESSNISKFMKRVNLKYFFYYSKKHNYIGHLWQDRFRSKLVEQDAYFIQCGKYIELNPVRANIVKSPEDYPFSSYLHYARGIKDALVDDDPLYLDLGDTAFIRQLAYRDKVDESVYERAEKENIILAHL